MTRTRISREQKRFCRQYCLSLRYYLSDLPGLRRRLVAQIQGDLWDYCEIHPDADEAELYGQFGRPEQAALDALATMGPKAVQRQLARGRWRRLLAWLAVGLAAAWALRTGGMYLINKLNPAPAYHWWQLGDEWPLSEEDTLQHYRDTHNGQSPEQLPPDAKPPEGVIVHASEPNQPNG